jgi:D-xylose transport system permease protein
VGYLTIPAFIVTLGGLLVWRNVAWYLTSGQTIGPLDETFQLFGGINGTLGETGSWIFGGCRGRRSTRWPRRAARKIAHDFPVKPVWARGRSAASSPRRSSASWRSSTPTRSPAPPGADVRGPRRGHARGLHRRATACPISVLLLIVVAVVMTVVAQQDPARPLHLRHRRQPRGRGAVGHRHAAADGQGLHHRALCALSAVVASARLTFHSNDIGTLDELRVIAAAVIGGTALSGGIGTIYGAILGALIMQSLQSGMAMVGVDAPFQNIVVGIVLVLAVLVDIIYRKRTGAK